jgi:hypothetical protein
VHQQFSAEIEARISQILSEQGNMYLNLNIFSFFAIQNFILCLPMTLRRLRFICGTKLKAKRKKRTAQATVFYDSKQLNAKERQND